MIIISCCFRGQGAEDRYKSHENSSEYRNMRDRQYVTLFIDLLALIYRQCQQDQYIRYFTRSMSNQNRQISDTDLLLLELQKNVFTDLGGPKLFASRHVINTFKGLTCLWVLFLMRTFNNYSPGMYLYLFLHGSYGILWVLKDIFFPDPRFKSQSTLGSLILIFLFLTLYWLIPVPLAAGLGVSEPSTARIILLIVMYISGLILMLGSDYQKYVALKQKPGLISDGFFSKTRNPNYLGQILIYSSFVLCSGHALGFIIFYGLACLFFALNIYLKDKTSLSLKKGWETYEKKSYVLLPKLLPTSILNFGFYSVLLLLLVGFLYQQAPTHFSNFNFGAALSTN